MKLVNLQVGPMHTLFMIITITLKNENKIWSSDRE